MEDLFEDGLFAYLIADATLAAAVTYTGAGSDTKYAIFKNQAKQDRPETYVVFLSTSDSPEYHAGGQCTARTISFNMSIFCGIDTSTAETVRDRLYALLSGYRAAAMGSIWIDFIHVTNVGAITESPIFGDEEGQNGFSMDFECKIEGVAPDPMA